MKFAYFSSFQTKSFVDRLAPSRPENDRRLCMWDKHIRRDSFPKFTSQNSAFCILRRSRITITRRNHNRAISSIGVGPMIWDNFSIFRTRLRHHLRHTRVKCSEEFCGKWLPKFPKSFMVLAHNSTRLCLLEFCWSVFVVSCSNLNEVRQCRI